MVSDNTNINGPKTVLDCHPVQKCGDNFLQVSSMERENGGRSYTGGCITIIY